MTDTDCSLHLARHLLTQHYFPPPVPLLRPEALEKCSVLELGAGTGVLAALLAPLCGSYVATDLDANLRLVRRNVEANAGAVKRSSGEAGRVATIEPLDWVEVSTARRRAESRGTTYLLDYTPDLVLAVDCIYNEHLVQPLVDTLSVACSKGAIAWVVVELRSSDVVSSSKMTLTPAAAILGNMAPRFCRLDYCTTGRRRHGPLGRGATRKLGRMGRMDQTGRGGGEVSGSAPSFKVV